MTPRRPAALGVDLASLAAVASGYGAQWSLTGERELDSNLVHLPPGEVLGEHVNADLDVLLIGIAGEGRVVVEGELFALHAAQLVFVPRGTRRRIVAGGDGVSYLTVHRRRRGLSIGSG